MVDLQVLHSCDNRVCININHLRLGTPQDNMDDKMRRGRWRGNVTDVTPAALETATPIE
jgi:hypothetical protein